MGIGLFRRTITARLPRACGGLGRAGRSGSGTTSSDSSAAPGSAPQESPSWSSIGQPPRHPRL